MRKYIAMALIVGATLAVVAMPALAKPEATGPACADVTDGSGTYIEGTVSLLANLAASPCKQVSYTLSVYSDDTMTEMLAWSIDYQDLMGADPQIGFIIPGIVDSDGIVCVVLTTSPGKSPNTFDRAPDADCMELSADPPALGGFH
jgi:hypothetical protein